MTTEPFFELSVEGKHARTAGCGARFTQGMLTTGTLTAALGFYEPFWSASPGPPQGLCEPWTLAGSLGKPPAAAPAGPSREVPSQACSSQKAELCPGGDGQLPAAQPVTAEPANVSSVTSSGRRRRSKGKGAASRAEAPQLAEAAEKLVRQRDGVCVRKAAEGISAVRCMGQRAGAAQITTITADCHMQASPHILSSGVMVLTYGAVL